MSDYYRSLEAPTKGRYLDKLRLLGLDEDGDPYAAHNEEKFIDDMSLWPCRLTHFLLLHRPPRCLHQASAATMEKLGGLQLLLEWACAHYKAMGTE